MKFKIFFSIIIPTFNPGKNLKDCLNSIKKLKDKTNFEVIIVDDKSTDNTLKVINKFRNDFCNFKLIKNKKNLGPGASRNLAINIAEGKYLVYLDSDDYFFPNILEKLEKLIIEKKFPDIALCNVQRSETKDNTPILKYFRKVLYRRSEFLKIAESKKIIFNECWNFVFKNDKSKKIRFLNTRLAEDNWYVTKNLLQCSKILILKNLKIIYHSSTIKSQKHLIGFEALKSYAALSKGYKKILLNQKNFNIRRYINYKIKINEKFLTDYLYLSNHKDLPKIHAEKIYAHLNFFKKLSNTNFFIFRLNFKNFLKDYEKKIQFFKTKEKFKYSCNIFCVDFIGKAALKYLIKNNNKINKIVDDDINLRGQSIMGKKIYSFKDLSNKEISSSYNIVCHQKLDVFQKIRKKLMNGGGKKSKIFHFFGA